jgi:rare lipoprotein A
MKNRGKGFTFIICILFMTVLCAAENKTQFGNAVANKGDRSLKASHAELAFGTRIRVTNQKNNKAVIVTVNGRIPKNPEQTVLIGSLAADNIEIDRNHSTPVLIEILGRKKNPPKIPLRALNPASVPPAPLPF